MKGRLTLMAAAVACGVGSMTLAGGPGSGGSSGSGGPIVMPVPIGFPIEGCGVIVADEVCDKLLKLDGSYYGFNGVDDYEVGDEVFVSGTVCTICLLTPCGVPWSAILGAQHSLCAPGDGGASGTTSFPSMGFPFAGCGEVVFDEVCEKLLNIDGSLYGFEGLDEHAVGELVQVSGMVCTICLLTPCGSPWSVIVGAEHAAVESCEANGGGMVVPVSECFTIATDANCGLYLVDESGEAMLPSGWPEWAPTSGTYVLVGTIGPFVLPAFCPSSEAGDIPFSTFQLESVTGCLGDLNVDGAVNAADLALLLGAWGACDATPECEADLTGDDQVNAADLAILLGAWTS